MRIAIESVTVALRSDNKGILLNYVKLLSN